MSLKGGKAIQKGKVVSHTGGYVTKTRSLNMETYRDLQVGLGCFPKVLPERKRLQGLGLHNKEDSTRPRVLHSNNPQYILPPPSNNVYEGSY